MFNDAQYNPELNNPENVDQYASFNTPEMELFWAQMQTPPQFEPFGPIEPLNEMNLGPDNTPLICMPPPNTQVGLFPGETPPLLDFFNPTLPNDIDMAFEDYRRDLWAAAGGSGQLSDMLPLGFIDDYPNLSLDNQSHFASFPNILDTPLNISSGGQPQMMAPVAGPSFSHLPVETAFSTRATAATQNWVDAVAAEPKLEEVPEPVISHYPTPSSSDGVNAAPEEILSPGVAESQADDEEPENVVQDFSNHNRRAKGPEEQAAEFKHRLQHQFNPQACSSHGGGQSTSGGFGSDNRPINMWIQMVPGSNITFNLNGGGLKMMNLNKISKSGNADEYLNAA